ncbi:hypothetical protein FQR65_LT12537 [Abscondita terminalis]|nr:hypothetical protein FQR65_LT12537 [Abscondita terminalis]
MADSKYGRDLSPSSNVENGCKKCKKKVANAVIKCIKCDTCYHKSCAQILAGQKEKQIDILNESELIYQQHSIARGNAHDNNELVCHDHKVSKQMLEEEKERTDDSLINKLKAENEVLLNEVKRLKLELNELKVHIHEGRSNAKLDNEVSNINRNDLLALLCDFKNDIYSKIDCLHQEVKLQSIHSKNIANPKINVEEPQNTIMKELTEVVWTILQSLYMSVPIVEK